MAWASALYLSFASAVFLSTLALYSSFVRTPFSMRSSTSEFSMIVVLTSSL